MLGNIANVSAIVNPIASVCLSSSTIKHIVQTKWRGEINDIEFGKLKLFNIFFIWKKNYRMANGRGNKFSKIEFINAVSYVFFFNYWCRF